MTRIETGRGTRACLFATLVPAVTLALVTSPALAQQSTTAQQDATQLPELLIEAERLLRPAVQISTPDDPAQTPAPDGGAYLRNQPGVSGSRMGGHGIDPVIRGQQGNRLNVTSDGAYVFGGCSSRMDPPSAYLSVDTYDRVIITQGYQSVTTGPGGPGGTVVFERDAPDFEPGKPYRLKLGGGWVSNGNTRDAFADVAAGQDGYYARAIGNWKKADNYEDGDGTEVRSAFEQRGYDLSVGYQRKGGSSLEVGFANDKVTDALFAGPMMDSPLSESRTFRVRGTHPVASGPLTEFRAEAYASAADHVMDNYSLRTRTAAMAARVDADSDTYGGKIAGDLMLGDNEVTVGIDLQENRREALRYTGMTDANVNTLASLNWPDTQIRQIGLFAEGTLPVAQATRLVLGGRYDRVDASLNRAAETVASTGRSPNDLYAMYYGTTGGDETEHNLGGLARVEHDLSASATVHVGVSRSVRTADAVERSNAADMMAMSWVGNPDIAPEKHHQGELGLTYAEKGLSIAASAYADRVEDFILRDTARGQDGVLLSNGATIYRNVDALLAGLTVEGKYRVTRNWVLSGDAAYTYGENLEDSKPLAQIPPLEASLALAYEADGWSVGTRLRGALKQTRVDDNTATGSGLDVRETPGWITQDIYAAIDLVAPFQVKLGVTNLFDTTYAYHLNRSNAFDATQVQVNEPGRSYYVRVSATF
jgi:iron complex outermembrane receptor protein